MVRRSNMEGLKIYRQADIEKLIIKRDGETKFGENIKFITNLDELKNHPARYVLLGIPEDIGVRANYGKPGAAKAWLAALNSLLNIQANRYNDASNLILLGELVCDGLMKKASYIDKSDPNYNKKLGDLVKQLDLQLSSLIEVIISNGKIPIIIGGGHNNAYGNINGAAKAFKEPVNVINIDAHTDLRQLEHRHSGNGFSYALEDQTLNKYSVFGLHKNYTPEYIFEKMAASENLHYRLLEDLIIDPENTSEHFKKAISEIDDTKFGFELDCDAILNFPSSAQSPSGFTIDQVRSFINQVSKNPRCCYFHICEAAPNQQNPVNVGKALSYFVSDIIRS